MKKPKLIWYWTSRGFGSELVYLLKAILYSEKYNYDIVLISRYSNISSGIGWQEYFEPFCEEKKSPFPFFHWWHPAAIVKIFNHFFRFQIKLMYGGSTITNMSIWHILFNPTYEFENFSSSKYGLLNSSCHESLHVVLKKIWNFNEMMLDHIANERVRYNYTNDCFAVHLRHGDKVSGIAKESDAVDNEMLYDYINSLGLNFSSMYILSDDHQKYTEFCEFFNSKSISTHCDDSQTGYTNYVFSALPSHLRKKEIIKLLVSVDFAVNAKYFIGPYSSNLSKIIYLLRNGVGCYNSERQPFLV